MKVLGIFILMITLLSVLTICMNFTFGLNLKEAFQLWARPLLLMQGGEKTFYILYPLVIVLLPVLRFIKNKRQGKKT
ncbi:hypothetical protein J2Z23_000749 [Lederbergia galactosidilyticus]|uniref:hypothetical protein n=1 Tax=Lederbergia galactosidilytica TaxID=217031 RepID=UPI001AE42AE1|nr:hypothetical protein [Lederbergia galactosidilytica]MBP1913812.1 hypothetical protein [Lederbergia galactosidilytica]